MVRNYWGLDPRVQHKQAVSAVGGTATAAISRVTVIPEGDWLQPTTSGCQQCRSLQPCILLYMFTTCMLLHLIKGHADMPSMIEGSRV
jgi:hypothetical protein